MRLMKPLGITLGGLASLYIVAIAGLYAAMRQPPERFGAIMSKVPMIGMMILPFRPLWMSARAGQLAVGDRAPDFTLPTPDHGRTVTLSGGVARTASCPNLRQLHLTAISPGGSRAQSPLREIQTARLFLHGLYQGGASHRPLADARQRARWRLAAITANRRRSFL